MSFSSREVGSGVVSVTFDNIDGGVLSPEDSYRATRRNTRRIVGFNESSLISSKFDAQERSQGAPVRDYERNMLSFTVLDNPTTISLFPDPYRKKTLAFDCVSVAASIFFINPSFLFPKTLAIRLNNPSPLLYVVLSYYQRVAG